MAAAVSSGQVDRGILICGTGMGMCIVANKFPGIRAAPCHDDLTAEMSRLHNDANVLCLSADLLGDRLVNRMVEKGYELEYAERIFKQIKGFGDYGFPESHAVSFALLAYISCWIKRHHPDAFLAALLNSQPMGFYAPAQLVRDARKNHVEVRPVDVTISACESTLEAPANTPREPTQPLPLQGGPLHAVRLGLDRILLSLLAVAEQLRMPEQGVVVDLELGIGGQHLAFGRDHQGVDLSQGGVALAEAAVEFVGDLDDLTGRLRIQSRRGDQGAQLEIERAERDIDRQLDDLVRVLVGHLFDVDSTH